MYQVHEYRALQRRLDRGGGEAKSKIKKKHKLIQVQAGTEAEKLGGSDSELSPQADPSAVQALLPVAPGQPEVT